MSILRMERGNLIGRPSLKGAFRTHNGFNDNPNP